MEFCRPSGAPAFLLAPTRGCACCARFTPGYQRSPPPGAEEDHSHSHFFFLYSPSTTSLAPSAPSPSRFDSVALSPFTTHLKLTLSPFFGAPGKFPFTSTSVT